MIPGVNFVDLKVEKARHHKQQQPQQPQFHYFPFHPQAHVEIVVVVVVTVVDGNCILVGVVDTDIVVNQNGCLVGI